VIVPPMENVRTSPPMRDSSSRISSGRVLGGKFEIVGVLGEGGTGIVYDAVRLAEKDGIALKVIHPHLLGDKQIRGRFTREAAILRRLEGAHLSAILDFGEIADPKHESAGLLYIALPKIEGIALDRLIKEAGPLPIERSLDIVLQVCEALNSAHAQGVIHRDLKPANVILQGGTHAIVVDFGMAKIVTGGGTGTTALTAHNMVFGTPEYMAPEQARGDELDARCDVYAVGVILYELLTGAVPFSGATPLNVLTAQLTAEPEPPTKRAPDRRIPKGLEAVVMHAIEKDPSKRYATAAALGAAIVHARARPEDTSSVRPGAYRIDVADEPTDGHSATLPAPIPTPHPPAPTQPSVGAALAPADTSRALGPRGWAIVWVAVVLASIGVGVWLSLRSN
jgi:eukaryotic-like serine/threonine-protein kinase